MIKQNTIKETSKSEKSNWKIEGREKKKNQGQFANNACVLLENHKS